MNRKSFLISVLFFLSGTAALLYEIVALRLFRRMLGTTTLAVATVLAAYMAGIAIGRLLSGRYALRLKYRLRAIGIAEIAAALLFLLLPVAIRVVQPMLRGIWPLLGDSPLAQQSVQTVTAIILMLPPSTLLGVGLPLLAAELAPAEDGSRESGLLYAVNCCGAAIGALAGGFLLLPLLGQNGTLAVAALLGATTGIIFLLLPRAGTHPHIAAALQESSRPRPSLLIAYGACGAATMAFEVGWTRALTLMIGSSVYAFALLLAVFIMGLTGGAAIASHWLIGSRRPALRLAVMIGIAAISSTVLIPLFHFLPSWSASAIREATGFWSIQLSNMLLAAILMLPTTLALGATFPLALEAATRRGVLIAPAIGKLGAANTLGAVLGSLASGMFLLPAIGLQSTLAMTITLLLAACVLLILSGEGPVRATIPALLLAIGVWFLPPWPVVSLTAAPFLHRSRTAHMHVTEPKQLKTLFYRDGVCSSVAVKESNDGERIIFLGGKPDASSAADIPNQVLVSQIPLLLHPAPQNCMIIGLASGISCGSAATHPLDDIACAEIEPAMLDACKLFAPYNGSVLEDSRFTLALADGRNFLELNPTRYDVIISEPTNPWIAGVADLFTEEFFATCRQRLTDDGVACIWLESYTLSLDAFRSIAAAFLKSFPSASLWNCMESDYLLIGHRDQRQSYSLRQLSAKITTTPILADLERAGVSTAADLLASFVTDSQGLRALSHGARPHTDNHTWIEFTAPRSMLDGKGRDRILAAVEAERRSPEVLFDPPPIGKDLAPSQARRQVMQGIQSALAGNQADAQIYLHRAWRLNPNDLFLDRRLRRLNASASQAIAASNPALAQELYGRITAIAPTHASAHYGLGYALQQLSRYADATRAYETAVQLAPEDVKAWLALSSVAFRLGNHVLTRHALQRAADLRADDPDILNNLAWAEATAASEGLDDADYATAYQLVCRSCTLSSWQDDRHLSTLLRIAAMADMQQGAAGALRKAARSPELTDERRAVLQEHARSMER